MPCKQRCALECVCVCVCVCMCVFACVLVYIWEKGSRTSNELENGGCMSEDGKGSTHTKVRFGVCVFVRVRECVCELAFLGGYIWKKKGLWMSNKLDNGGCMSESAKVARGQRCVLECVCAFLRVCVCTCVGVYMEEGLADE